MTRKHTFGQQAIDFCTTELNTQKLKAFLDSKKRINTYKIKYTRNGTKLPPTHSFVQNKPREPINTPIAFMDLVIHIYD
jgi:hypothetical protein